MRRKTFVCVFICEEGEEVRHSGKNRGETEGSRLASTLLPILVVVGLCLVVCCYHVQKG